MMTPKRPFEINWPLDKTGKLQDQRKVKKIHKIKSVSHDKFCRKQVLNYLKTCFWEGKEMYVHTSHNFKLYYAVHSILNISFT